MGLTMCKRLIYTLYLVQLVVSPNTHLPFIMLFESIAFKQFHQIIFALSKGNLIGSH